MRPSHCPLLCIALVGIALLPFQPASGEKAEKNAEAASDSDGAARIHTASDHLELSCGTRVSVTVGRITFCVAEKQSHYFRAKVQAVTLGPDGTDLLVLADGSQQRGKLVSVDVASGTSKAAFSRDEIRTLTLNAPMNVAATRAEQSSLLAQNRQLCEASAASLRDTLKSGLAEIKRKYKDSLENVATKNNQYETARSRVKREKDARERRAQTQMSWFVRNGTKELTAAIKDLHKAEAELKAAGAAYEAVRKQNAADEAKLKETVAAAIRNVEAAAAKHDVILHGGGELAPEKVQQRFATICAPVLQQWGTAASDTQDSQTPPAGKSMGRRSRIKPSAR